jgi:hypothetical protein
MKISADRLGTWGGGGGGNGECITPAAPKPFYRRLVKDDVDGFLLLLDISFMSHLYTVINQVSVT